VESADGYCPDCGVSVLAERVRLYVEGIPAEESDSAELRGFFREISRAVDQVAARLYGRASSSPPPKGPRRFKDFQRDRYDEQRADAKQLENNLREIAHLERLLRKADPSAIPETKGQIKQAEVEKEKCEHECRALRKKLSLGDRELSRIASRTHPDIKLAREAEKLEKTRAYYAEKVRQLQDGVRRADEELEALQARKAELLPQCKQRIEEEENPQRRNDAKAGHAQKVQQLKDQIEQLKSTQVHVHRQQQRMVKSSNASLERDLKAYYQKERTLKEVENEIKRVTHGSRKLFDTIPAFLRDRVPKHLRPWEWPEGRGGFDSNTEQIDQIEDSAAVRIQSAFRGKKTRRHLRARDDLYQHEQEKAALRIQAQVRRNSKHRSSKQNQQEQAQAKQARGPESPTAASMYSARTLEDQTVAEAEAGADQLAAKAAELRAALASNDEYPTNP
jgi:hypothetical protein